MLLNSALENINVDLLRIKKLVHLAATVDINFYHR